LKSALTVCPPVTATRKSGFASSFRTFSITSVPCESEPSAIGTATACPSRDVGSSRPEPTDVTAEVTRNRNFLNCGVRAV
jgi:hypothetical protein